MKYKHLFIDLDYTLYDFEKSSRITIQEFYDQNNLREKGIADFAKFFSQYKEINHALWEDYRNGDIEKADLNVKRFYLAMKEFGLVSDTLAKQFASYYVNESPLKKTLFPGVEETLDFLYPKYSMHIITNGFAEVQAKKIKANKLSGYIKEIITSEEAGCKKPDSCIFQLALDKTGATKENSLMIGDDQETDIAGAINFGIDQVYVNYNSEELLDTPTYEIHTFPELKEILKKD